VRRGLPVPETPRAEIGLLEQGEHGLLLAPDGTPGWLLAETGQTVTALLDPLAPESLAGLLAQVQAQAAQRGRVACLYKITARTAAQARAAGYPDAKTAQTAVDAGEADAAAALWAEDGTYDVEGWSMRGRAEVAPRSPRWCAPPNIRA